MQQKAESDDTNLQSAKENLLEEIQKTKKLFTQNDIDYTIICNVDEIEKHFDSNLFSEDTLSNVAKSGNEIEQLEEENNIPGILNTEQVTDNIAIENASTGVDKEMINSSEEVTTYNNSRENTENSEESSDEEVQPTRQRAKRRWTNPKTWK